MTWLSKVSQNDGLNVTGVLPVGVADGMAMGAFVSHEAGFGADTGLFTAVTGWDLHYSILDTNGEDRVTGFYTRKASSEPASYVFPHASTTNSNTSVIIVATDEVDADDLWDVVLNTAVHKTTQNNSNAPGSPDITTATDGAFVLTFAAVTHDDITGIVAPATFTAMEGGFGGTYNDCQIMGAYKEIPTAGLVSPGSWQNTDNGTVVAESTKLIVAWKPAPAGGTPTIEDIGTDDVVTDGQTGANIALSGFTGTPTLKLKYGAIETANLTYSGDNTGGTYNVPDQAAIVGDTTMMPIGKVVKLVATYLTETAEADLTINAKAGWATQDALSASFGEGYFTDETVPDASIAYYDTANNTTVAANFIYETDGSVINGVFWNSSNGLAKDVIINITTYSPATYEEGIGFTLNGNFTTVDNLIIDESVLGAGVSNINNGNGNTLAEAIAFANSSAYGASVGGAIDDVVSLGTTSSLNAQLEMAPIELSVSFESNAGFVVTNTLICEASIKYVSEQRLSAYTPKWGREKTLNSSGWTPGESEI